MKKTHKKMGKGVLSGRKRKNRNLNAQLIAVFFAAVLLLSLGHFFLYARLFRTLGTEEEIISAERMDNVQMKLASVFDQGEKAALEILTSPGFQALAGVKVVGNDLLELEQQAEEIMEEVNHAARWFVMMEGSSELITTNGCCDPETFFNGLCVSPGYDWQFWQDRFHDAPGMHYYTAADFSCRGKVGKYENMNLMPMSYQSYYDRELMVVLMLDIGSICREDTYLQSGAYFFSQEGELLYTTDETPLVTQMPETEKLTLDSGEYTVKRHDVGGPVCVKLQKSSAASNLLRNNFILCLAVAVAALVAIAVLVPTIIKTLLTPVDKMVDLVRQHGAPKDHTDLHGISRELEQIIQTREQQAADLARKNAELSEYRLHARIKNVYVDLNAPEETGEGQTYLLYIQITYMDKALESFTVSRAELENCLQEMMGSTLEKLFATVVIFQTEQGRFAARVALHEGQDKPKEALAKFMTRLEQEKEFAAFTVVCSKRLSPGVQLAQVYDEVRAGVKLAKVGRGSQLIMAGSKDKTAYLYPKTDEQRLDDLVRNQKIPQAAALAERLLRQNVDVGISHAQMEILSVAVVNTAAYAASAAAGNHKTAAASVVYNALATSCQTLEDYIETVVGYIRSMEQPATAPAEDQEQLLGRVRQYLQENYHKEFSVEEMASALWVSRSYLSSYYKSKTGSNLSDAIQGYRIEKAKELLKDPEVKIGDVGAMVGIPSPNTFLRQFRKYTDMTPKEYRQTQK